MATQNLKKKKKKCFNGDWGREVEIRCQKQRMLLLMNVYPVTIRQIYRAETDSSKFTKLCTSIKESRAC